MLDIIKNFSFRSKVSIIVILTAFISISLTGLITYYRTKTALGSMAEDQLNSINVISKNRINDYFRRSYDYTILLAKDRLTEGLFLAYESAFYGSGYSIGKDEKLDSPSFKNLDKSYLPKVQRLMEAFRIANLALVNINGQIVFSYQPDTYGWLAGRSLTKGPLQDKKIGACYRHAMSEDGVNPVFADYEYVSEFNKTMTFLCLKTFSEFDHLSEGIKKGDVMGVVIVEISTDQVNKLLSSREGMGTSGQTYLVGDDSLLRSDFFLEKDTHNIITSHKAKTRTDSPSIKAAVAGQSGLKTVIDPLAKQVISSFSPIEIMGHKWAILVEKRTEEVFAPVNTTLLIVIGVSFVLMLFAVIGAYFISGVLVKPLTEAADILRRVTVNLGSDSDEMNEAAGTLNRAAKDQTEGIQNSVSAITEINSSVQANAKNSEKSAEFSKESLVVAERGRTTVNEMIGAVEEIHRSNDEVINQLNNVNSNMGEIRKLFDDISAKTKIINDIVFQTKLLSFNAAIEAARAGEHGKGFSVVAEEIGNLATVSGTSAQEINDILLQSTEKVEQLVRETKNSILEFGEISKIKLRLGTETAQRCGDVFNEIQETINKISEMSVSISQATTQQERGMIDIGQTMHELEVGAENTNKISTNTAESADKLSLQAGELKEVVRVVMRTLMGG